MRQADTAIILAGGNSTRMGFDKEFLVINEQVLLELLITKLRTIFDQVIVVSNNCLCYSEKGAEVVSDELVGLGPLGGIHAGLKASRSIYSYVIACDMPNLNMEYISFLQSKLPYPENGELSALATVFGDHIEPFNAFYNRSLIEPIEKYSREGQRSLTTFLRIHRAALIDEATARLFSPDWSMFANINTPADKAQYQTQKRYDDL